MKRMSYANSTALIIKSETWSSLKEEANKTMFEINNWFVNKKLYLKIKKTLYA